MQTFVPDDSLSLLIYVWPPEPYSGRNHRSNRASQRGGAPRGPCASFMWAVITAFVTQRRAPALLPESGSQTLSNCSTVLLRRFRWVSGFFHLFVPEPPGRFFFRDICTKVRGEGSPICPSSLRTHKDTIHVGLHADTHTSAHLLGFNYY